jgi:hypothetical protein
MLGNNSKWIGSLVGGIMAWIVARFALPPEWASADMVQALTMIVGTLFVYLFPANVKS